MKSITHTTVFGAASAMVALTMLLMPWSAGAASAITFEQGFEVNTAHWITGGAYGTIERVMSGTDGITSAAGNWHAIVEQTDAGPFSRFDGYRNVWTGEWIAQIAVYLDPAALESGEGFDYSVAANGTDNNHQRDFIFHVSKDTSSGKLLVGGSNNTNFAPRQDLESINHIEITEAGWYTLEHRFYDNGGQLAVDLNLLDSDGAVLFTETRTSASDTIPAEVGGNRYAWFTNIDVDGGVAIDAHTLEVQLPDPAAKQDCMMGDFELYGFKNQGQCVKFAETGKDSR